MKCELRTCDAGAQVWAHVGGRPMRLCIDCLAAATKRVVGVVTHWDAPLDEPCPEPEIIDEERRLAQLAQELAHGLAQSDLGARATEAQVAAAAPRYLEAAANEITKSTHVPAHPKRTAARGGPRTGPAATPGCRSSAVRSPATRAQSLAGDAAQAAQGGAVAPASAPSSRDASSSSAVDGTTHAGAIDPAVVPVDVDASAPGAEAVVVAEAPGVHDTDSPPLEADVGAPLPPEPPPTPEPAMPTDRSTPTLREDADAHPEACRIRGCPNEPRKRGLCAIDYQRGSRAGWLAALALPSTREPKQKGVESGPAVAPLQVAERVLSAREAFVEQELSGVDAALGLDKAGLPRTEGDRAEAIDKLKRQVEMLNAELDGLRAFRLRTITAIGDLQGEPTQVVAEVVRHHAILIDRVSVLRTGILDALGTRTEAYHDDQALLERMRELAVLAAATRFAPDAPSTRTLRQSLMAALGLEDESQVSDEDLIAAVVRARRDLDTTAASYRELSRAYADVRGILAEADPSIAYVAMDDLAQQLADRHRALREAADAAGAAVGPTPLASSARAVDLAARLGALEEGLRAAFGFTLDDGVTDMVGLLRDAPELRVSAASYGHGTLQVVIHGDRPSPLPIGGRVRLVPVAGSR